MTEVYIIIINWNNSQLTLEAISSIKKYTSYDYKIILVDNGSTDSSLKDFIGLPPNVKLIINDINLGFGSGCNIGIRYAIKSDAKYVLLLNNDAKLKSNIIKFFIDKYSNNKNIGAIAGTIVDVKNSNYLHSGYYLNPLTLSSYPVVDTEILNSKKFAWITAAVVFIPTSVFKEVGLFDENYFMYWEDFDLIYRIKQAGYILEVSTDALVEHTAGTSSDSNKLLRYEWHLTSGIIWLRKNHPFYIYSVVILFLRSVAKSVLTLNLPRLNLTLKFILNFLFNTKINEQ